MGAFNRLIRSNSSNDIRDKLEKQNDFLEALIKYVRIGKACKEAGITMTTLNEWKREDLMFRQRFEEAQEAAMITLEDVAIKRAMNGVKVPIYHEGKHVGDKRVYSDTLMQTILKAKHEDYKDKDEKTKEGELPPLLILPTNGREIKELPSDTERIEIPKENELDTVDELLKKAKEEGGGIIDELNDEE